MSVENPRKILIVKFLQTNIKFGGPLTLSRIVDSVDVMAIEISIYEFSFTKNISLWF